MWDPDRYELYKKERSAPYEDLFKLIHVRPGMQVVDLGCGTGELTAKLADSLPNSQVLGIDSSREMLERAYPLEQPRLHFQYGLIEEVTGAWDLVFSNAAIQWIADHASLIPRLFGLVKPGGQIVIQIPSNHTHPTHQLIVEVASQEPFRQALGGWTRQSPVLSIDAYAALLYRLGGEDITVFEKVYPHILADADALAKWTSGTALLPYKNRLPDNLWEEFMQLYRQRLRQVWPEGPVFYPFRRTLFAATRGRGE